MRVAVRVDAGPLIGGGHTMRCLTLADALAKHGSEVMFVTASMPEELSNRIEASGHKLVGIAAPAGFDRECGDWHEPPLDVAVQDLDARTTAAATGAVDWLIVDHYLFDASWHKTSRSFAGHILVIDDLANRPYDCDLLIDQTFGRCEADYRGLLPPHARVLAGTNYALLRPEFERERAAAIERRKEARGISRILLSMGMTDIGGSTASILDDVLSAAPDCHVDVVIGAAAPGLRRVRQLAERDPRITVHVDSHEMARLIRDADLAIGAAGTTSWERCCLGLPTVAVIVAENQRPSATALSDAGAVIVVERVEEVSAALRALIGDPHRLAQMSTVAFAITDGRGADRVASAVLGKSTELAAPVELRPATMDDAETLWLWRNDPLTRAQSRNTEPIAWTSHVRWLSLAFADAGQRILIAESDGIPVGTIGFHSTGGAGSEVSITVSAGERGRGLGRAILSAACAQSPTQDVYASVRIENESSRRLFESSGFARVESTESGFVRYFRKAEHPRRKQA
jgi:UDP-2,4-diacetamido-2,4,6-trideoxy-beta-L-altropyranose hydrolase